ncbi:MAG: PilW family protein [Gaiellaceae bacterium]
MRRVTADGGYSVIELLTTMAILSIVLGTLTSLFVSGTKAELDMNDRFRAQQNAALALTKIRREVHCASVATTTGTAVTLTLPSYCKTGQGSITWCTVSVATSRFALYRKAGTTCDATGVKWSDYLTSGSAFTYIPQSTTSLAKLGVVFPVDADATDTFGVYRLEDSLVLRNSLRAAP